MSGAGARQLFRRQRAVPAGEPLSGWLPATGDEARKDIGRALSQRPDGPLVDQEIARLMAGHGVFGYACLWQLDPEPAELPPGGDTAP